jgi:HK97 family phage portal protein
LTHKGAKKVAIEKRGFWSKIFKKPDKQIVYVSEDILSGRLPIFWTDRGESVYVYDVVQQAIYSIVTELKKLDPVHVRSMHNGDFVAVDGNVQSVLDAPNPFMTTSDFIEKVAWILLLNYNAFIYPIWDGKILKALYPLQPTLVEFDYDYGGSGQTWCRFHFANGFYGDLPYENIIHLRHKFSMSEIMGGNADGQPDLKPLEDTVKLNDALLKGLAKSLNLQTSINGMVKLKTMANKDDQEEKIREFEQKLRSNESGIGIMDISGEYIPIQKQIQLLDATTLEFIDKKIFRWYGVSIPFVDGTATPQEYDSVYQKTLEPMVKSWGQAFTKGIFTNHAAQGFKNQIKFYTKELLFMSMDQKIKLFDILVDSESCYKNEMRSAFGMRPLAQLEGQLAASSNKTNAENNKQQNGGNDDEGNGG